MDERTVFQSISQKHVLSLGPRASVREAAGAMTRANCGSVLIMEPPHTLLGIVTERDLMTRVLAKALDPEKTTVREIMTPNPVCVPPETSVSDAVLIMIERGSAIFPSSGRDRRSSAFSRSAMHCRARSTPRSARPSSTSEMNDALG